MTDAYHSLSIEGYRVTATLIEKIRDGNWNPDGDEKDRATRDAMAARGYFETHNLVKEDLVRVIKGDNAGTVFRNALPRWYQALFSPSVQAGILKASDLAGYRNDQVFIRGALHVPLSKEAVRDCMPVSVRTSGSGSRAASARGARTLPFRLHSSVHGRKWPAGEIPDEPDARSRRLCLDGDSGREAQRVHGCARAGELVSRTSRLLRRSSRT